MSTVRPSRAQARVVLALALLTAAIAACDRGAASPTELRPATARPAAIEGDTLRCLKGWIIINGAYACNEDT